MTQLLRNIKPYYPKGDHALWSDIVSDLTPYQAIRTVFKYDHISFGLSANKIGIDMGLNNINIGRIQAFADKYITRWEQKLEFADRFLTPSQRRGLIK